MADNEKYIFGKYFLWAMAAFSAISISLYFISSLTPTSPFSDPIKQISVILFSFVAVSLIHEKVLGDYYQHQAEDSNKSIVEPYFKDLQVRLNEKVETIGPALEKTLGDKIVEDLQVRVSKATDAMLDGIDVLSGAKKAGIANIFPNRYDKVPDRSLIDTIKDDLVSETTKIKIMGISLGDYFLHRGGLHQTFIDVLNKGQNGSGPKIQTLTVNPHCEALRVRAKWEVGKQYYDDPAFYECTTFIETDGAAKIARRLCDEYKFCLQSRLYKEPPLAFVLLTSRFAFIEPYHYADRGSNVPVIQVQAGSKIYNYYEEHFDRIWESADPINSYKPLP
jgi:hypothetical protein